MSKLSSILFGPLVIYISFLVPDDVYGGSCGIELVGFPRVGRATFDKHAELSHTFYRKIPRGCMV